MELRPKGILVRPLQPSPADRHVGGWTEVLDYIRSDRFLGAFRDNDFIVIHVDTDVWDRTGFDVLRHDPDGRERTIDELIDRVRDRLVECIGASAYEQHRGQILFAVCVDAMECWLLPLLYRDDRRSLHTGCLAAVNDYLAARDELPFGSKRKRVHRYRKLARDYAEPGILTAHGAANPSLARFITDLHATLASA